MDNTILTAIKSLCVDIAASTDSEENKKRAEAIALLSSLNTPASGEYNETKENKVKGNNIPKSGEKFIYNGMEFVALGEEQGGILAIMAHELGEKMPYDKDNGKNDWRKSTLRKYLNEEFLEVFYLEDLLPFVSDLTSDDGMKDYGTSMDYMTLLSCDLYRKYREFIPKYNAWVWTITPWSCLPGNADCERCVYADGSLSYNFAHNANGVAPACIFSRSIFE